MRAIRMLLAAVVALVLGAAARPWSPGAVFARSLGKGSYKVKWRALADDGHHERGSWTFKVS